jgi:hypothetical protein
MNPEKFNTEKISINNIQHRISSIKSKITKQEKLLNFNLKELLRQRDELENTKKSGYIKDDNGDIISIADAGLNIEQDLLSIESNIKDIRQRQQKLFERSLRLLQTKEKTNIPVMEYCVNIFQKIMAIFKTYPIEESSKLEKSINKFFDELPKHKQPNQKVRHDIIHFFKHNYNIIKNNYLIKTNLADKADKKDILNKKTGKDAAAGE